MGKRYLYNLRRKMQVIFLKLTSPEIVSSTYYWIVFKRKLHIKSPVTFNEKIQWLKLYYWPNQPKAIQCADKYAVREYVKEKGYGENLNELFGTWEDARDIDWDMLPKQFVLKCNHGCGYNIICNDKSKLNYTSTISSLNKWIDEDFSLYNAEAHMGKIPRKIICEKYLGEDIIDYKFFCFKGKVEFMYIAQGFGYGIGERITFFDEKGNKMEAKRGDYPELVNAHVPQSFDQMKKMSEVFATDFPFVRVDWFEVNGKILFSELTFTPCAGLMKIEPLKYDEIWGKLLELPTEER